MKTKYLLVSMACFLVSFCLAGLLVGQNDISKLESNPGGLGCPASLPGQAKCGDGKKFLELNQKSFTEENSTQIARDPLVNEAKQNLELAELFLFPINEIKTKNQVTECVLGLEYSHKFLENLEHLTEEEALGVFGGDKARLDRLTVKLDQVVKLFEQIEASEKYVKGLSLT